MQTEEKEVSYQSNNSYSTLNTFSDSTKNVWFVCHGLGYLSKYFIQYFKNLDPIENYVIAPQASSKYYQTKEFKHVGASWLTKENTKAETKNVLNYFDAILKAEKIDDSKHLILFGYSQGVSVATRFLKSRQPKCDLLILHSGGLPQELKAEDFNFFYGNVHLIYGVKDPYLTSDRIKLEIKKVKSLFGEEVFIHPFEGVHEMNPKVLENIIK